MLQKYLGQFLFLMHIWFTVLAFKFATYMAPNMSLVEVAFFMSVGVLLGMVICHFMDK